MKKFLIFIALSLGASQMEAQSPYSDPAVPEDYYPSGQSWHNTKRFLSHSAANAYGGHYNPTILANTDVYTYSWDEWDPDPSAPALNFAGFAVKEMGAGSQIFNGAGPATNVYFNLGDASLLGPGGYTVSVEASLMYDGSVPGQTYIAVTYYRESSVSPYQPGYFLELFHWNGFSLTSVNITPLSEPYFGAVGKGIIHHDVQRAGRLVLAFEANGRIYTQSLRVSGGLPVLSGLGNLGFGSALTRPDVAMSRLGNGNTELYYVANDNNNEKLYVLGTDLSAVDAIPPFTVGVIPAVVKDAVFVWDIFGTPPSPVTFDLPRIDAPDISPSGEETWSWVVSEHGADRDYVRSGYYNRSVSSSVRHDYLNRSITIPTFDISMNPGNWANPINQRAVVAFGEDAEVYYAWVRVTDGAVPTPLLYPSVPNSSYTGYISHKLDKFGNCLNNMGTGAYAGLYDYDKVNDDPYNAGMMASVALGSCNYNLQRLFSSFMLGDPTITTAYGYQIGHKTTDWTTAQFRPGSTSIKDNTSTLSFNALPNPFQSNVKLDFKGMSQQENLSLKVSNLLGQTVLTKDGYPEELNKVVQERSASWDAGLYLIQVSGKPGIAIQKVIKQ